MSFYLENRTPPISNIAYFWRKGGCGYTSNIDEAQIFSEQEADQIIERTRSSHFFVKHSASDVEEKAYRAVNIDDLPNGGFYLWRKGKENE